MRLFATAAAGSFLGWTEACRGQGECTVTMDQDRSMGALFGTPGEALWAMQIGNTDSDYGKGITIDSNGDIIAVGVFKHTITAGSELISAGESDVYVVKLASSTGGVIWAKRFGGTLDDGAFAVSTDGSNNIYVFGFFAGSVDFGDGPLTVPVGEIAAFVLKLDENGSFRWVRKFDGHGFAYTGANGGDLGSIATDGDSVVVAGKFGRMTVDATTVETAGGTDMFALKLSTSSGARHWVKHFGGTGDDDANGVSLDGNGDVLLTGIFDNTVYFDGSWLSAPGPGPDGFLLKLDGSTGEHLLSRKFGSPSAAGVAVAVDSKNNILITGSFQATPNLGCVNNPMVSQPDASDVLLVKYTPAGSCIWAKGFGGVSTTLPYRYGQSIAVNSSGEISIAGSFYGPISFGGEPLVSVGGSSDVFATRFDGDGRHLTSVRSGGTSSDSGHGVAQSPDGRSFVTGRFEGFAEFGSITFNSAGGADAFIVEFAPL